MDHTPYGKTTNTTLRINGHDYLNYSLNFSSLTLQQNLILDFQKIGSKSQTESRKTCQKGEKFARTFSHFQIPIYGDIRGLLI